MHQLTRELPHAKNERPPQVSCGGRLPVLAPSSDPPKGPHRQPVQHRWVDPRARMPTCASARLTGTGVTDGCPGAALLGDRCTRRWRPDVAVAVTRRPAVDTVLPRQRSALRTRHTSDRGRRRRSTMSAGGQRRSRADLASARLPRRRPGSVVDDQRTPVPRRADVHGGGRRCRRHADRQPQR
jgi:hypothetical protein